jgi:hypothetical protein
MTYDLCSSLLGKEHPASIMAKEDPSVLFPELVYSEKLDLISILKS